MSTSGRIKSIIALWARLSTGISWRREMPTSPYLSHRRLRGSQITYSGKFSSCGLIWIGRLCQRCIFFPTTSLSPFPHINFGQLGMIHLPFKASGIPNCSGAASFGYGPWNAESPDSFCPTRASFCFGLWEVQKVPRDLFPRIAARRNKLTTSTLCADGKSNGKWITWYCQDCSCWENKVIVHCQHARLVARRQGLVPIPRRHISLGQNLVRFLHISQATLLVLIEIRSTPT
jgi:hypothetical protein